MSWVLCAGMIRSGSTLQYQITSKIVEYSGLGRRLKYLPESEFERLVNQYMEDNKLKVVKVHICNLTLENLGKKSQTKIIYCHRDIRDVAVSAMRKFDMSFDELVNAGWLDQAITDYNLWTNMPNVLVSRYDQMIVDLKNEMSRISEFLELKISDNTLINFAKDFDIPAQKQRIDALKAKHGKPVIDSEIVFDEVELLHHNHIHIGEVDGWRHILSTSQQSFLTNRYGRWLSSLGYNCD